MKRRITNRTTMYLECYHARFAGFWGDGSVGCRARNDQGLG
jgi:hypothetical protein